MKEILWTIHSNYKQVENEGTVLEKEKKTD